MLLSNYEPPAWRKWLLGLLLFAAGLSARAAILVTKKGKVVDRRHRAIVVNSQGILMYSKGKWVFKA